MNDEVNQLPPQPIKSKKTGKLSAVLKRVKLWVCAKENTAYVIEIILVLITVGSFLTTLFAVWISNAALEDSRAKDELEKLRYEAINQPFLQAINIDLEQGGTNLEYEISLLLSNTTDIPVQIEYWKMQVVVDQSEPSLTYLKQNIDTLIPNTTNKSKTYLIKGQNDKIPFPFSIPDTLTYNKIRNEELKMFLIAEIRYRNLIIGNDRSYFICLRFVPMYDIRTRQPHNNFDPLKNLLYEFIVNENINEDPPKEEK